jgi:multidrug efflux system membrane fusion protein
MDLFISGIRISKGFTRHAASSLLLCLVSTAFLASCAGNKDKPRPKPAVPVTVAAAMQMHVPVQLKATGNVEAYSTVAIKAQVNGAVDRVHFTEGQDVKKGDLLFTIDSRPFEAVLRQAEANLSRDMAQARNAEEQARRYGALLKDGIVTQEQYDQLRTAAEAFSATAAADRAAVENARVQLGYCYIRSPLTGRTGDLRVHAGNVVRANEDPALVTINQINPVHVTFSVPEKDLPEIKRRMAAGDLKVEAMAPVDSLLADSSSMWC